jgi:NAD(P)-dependent dehydrogenase (short-subunit alcohol dehydrogenase family)
MTDKGDNMGGRLQDKVAVVTGGGSGIGRAIAQALHRQGAKVVVADISGEEKAAAEALGSGAIAFGVDVTKASEVTALMQAAVDAFGRVDILCQAAGIEGDLGPTGECAEDNFDRVMAVNVKGTFLGMRAVLPLFAANGSGAIVNMASMASWIVLPGMPAYCASKGAVLQLTRTAAVEYATAGIRINAICPGAVDTPMLRRTGQAVVDASVAATPMGRLARPEEIAALAVFLASDDASYVTGAGLTVDGGYSAL